MAQPRLDSMLDRLLLLQGQTAARALPTNEKIKNLTQVEFGVYSQWGEDGIIEWLISHTCLPNRRFVEFGVEDFREANCRFLLVHRNWKGLVMDGSTANISALKQEDISWRQDLKSKAAFITRENIDQLICEEGFAGDLGVLSIDLDGNDYWIWESIQSVNPAIVICEYNSMLGDIACLSVPYEPGFQRFRSHFSGAYYGCSISALKHIGNKKGYTFVGTNSNGINAFFVRRDLATDVLALLEEPVAFPSRHRGGRKADGSLAFEVALERLHRVVHLPVIDVVTGKTAPLGEIEHLYSERWKAGMS
jgi:hypothetical protein